MEKLTKTCACCNDDCHGERKRLEIELSAANSSAVEAEKLLRGCRDYVARDDSGYTRKGIFEIDLVTRIDLQLEAK